MTTTVLVLGATGKTGRRVAQRLAARAVEVRAVSRSTRPGFDWTDESTWEPVLRGVDAAYVVYAPDIGVPEAEPVLRAFAELAVHTGVRRFVLLSGRGEEGARRSERAVLDSGIDCTILRCGWFFQALTEDFLLDGVLAGTIALPAGEVAEPFVDAGDIADVAVAALLDERPLGNGHRGRSYELTGPRSLTCTEVAAEISAVTGRDIRYRPVSARDYSATLTEHGIPAEQARWLAELFATVLDGRNTRPADGVERALGRPPRDFADFAREVAATGVWTTGPAGSVPVVSADAANGTAVG